MAVEGWVDVSLDDICEIKIGGTPSRSVSEYWAEGQDGHPWVSISDLHQNPILSTKETITDAGVEKSNVKLIKAGTSLMSFKLTIGRVSRAGVDLYTNEAIAAFEPKNRSIDEDFLYHVLPIAALTGDTDQAVKGKTLNKEKLKALKLSLPSQIEQKKIAEILGSVDEAIAKTEAVIAQTQKVKQGLLQTLFTKGIGHTKFKQTEIGEIPEGWEVSSIEQLSDRVTSGSRGWADYYSDEGAAFIRITNLKRDCIYPDVTDLKRVQLPAGSAEGVRTRIRVGDLLISITADLGIIGYIKDDSLSEAYVNQHISLVSLDAIKIHPGFAAYSLSSPAMQRHIQKLNDGGAKAGLNLATIRKLPLPLPDMKEQIRIFQTLKEVDDYLIESKEQIISLQSLKKGLMSDLLTGRVRAKLDKKSEMAA